MAEKINFPPDAVTWAWDCMVTWETPDPFRPCGLCGSSSTWYGEAPPDARSEHNAFRCAEHGRKPSVSSPTDGIDEVRTQIYADIYSSRKKGIRSELRWYDKLMNWIVAP